MSNIDNRECSPKSTSSLQLGLLKGLSNIMSLPLNLFDHKQVHVFLLLKHGFQVGYVSLNGAQPSPLFSIYTSSFKKFGNQYFKLKSS